MDAINYVQIFVSSNSYHKCKIKADLFSHFHFYLGKSMRKHTVSMHETHSLAWTGDKWEFDI